MKTVFWAILLIAVATPAAADPASLIITSLGITSAVGVALVRLGVGLILTQLAKAATPTPDAPDDPGIRTEAVTTGGIGSQTLILGKYATAGNLVAPFMAHGEVEDTPNAYRTMVIDLCDMPITSIEFVYIDDRRLTAGPDLGILFTEDFGIDFGGNQSGELGRGAPVLNGIFSDKAWIKFFNGTQTEAPFHLIDVYGSRSRRPWSADMIGRDLSYVVMTFEFDREIYQSDPRLLFSCKGIALYDPRADDTAGGSGAQRYGDTATHVWSENPMVMIYNLLRGIQLPTGEIYGLGVDAADLPFDIWSAAMDACDDGARYTAGFEIRIGDDEPLAIIDELLKACDGDVVDVGGTWYARAGRPGLPVRFFTDDDLLRTRAQELDPFPTLDATFNGVHVNYVSPSKNWKPRDCPPRYDLDAEAEDGRRLVAEVNLPAVTRMSQAQRLGRAWLRDARRMRRHSITIGPEGLLLNPLDIVSWTSARNGYDAKLFEVVERVVDPKSLSVTLALRERDPSDYDWQASDELPTTPPSTDIADPAPQVLPNFALVPFVINDDTGARRPALLMTWTGSLPDVRAIRYRVRVKSSGEVIVSGSTHDVERLQHAVTEGILPGVEYEAQARMVTDRPTVWTPWVSAVAPDVRLGREDIGPAAITAEQLAQEINDQIDAAEAGAQAAAADAVAAIDAANLAGDLAVRLSSQAAGVLTDNAMPFAPGWNRNGTGVTVTQAASTYFPHGNDLTLDVTGDGTFGSIQTTSNASLTDGPFWVGPNNADAYHFELIVTLNSGSVANSHFRIVYFGGHGNSFNEFFGLEDLHGGPLPVGEAVSLTGIATRPDNYAAPHNRVQPMLVMQPGGVPVTASLTVHAIIIRPATAAEVTAEGNAAAIIAEQTARADADSAIAADLTALTATVGGLDASVTTNAAAIATLDGVVSARYTLEVQAGTSGAILDLIAPGGGPSVAQLDADFIYLKGRVTADSLTVGLGRNMLYNTDFSQGERGFALFSDGAIGAASFIEVLEPGSDYAGTSFRTMRLRTQADNTTTGGFAEVRSYRMEPDGSIENRQCPVTPGEYYMFQCKASTRNCDGNLRIRWVDKDGVFVAWSVEPLPYDVRGDINEPDKWPLYFLKAQAPAGAAYAHMAIRALGTQDGNFSTIESWQWMFSHVHEFATDPPDYDSGNTTLIDADGLYTDAIDTRHIRANAITAASGILANASIVQANIQNAAVDTLQIAGEAVTATQFGYNDTVINITNQPDRFISQVTVNRTSGFETFLTLTLVFEPASDTADTQYQLKLYRNGNAIETVNSAFLYETRVLNPLDAVANFTFVDTNTGGGSATYEFRINTGLSIPEGAEGNISRRITTAQQFKR